MIVVPKEVDLEVQEIQRKGLEDGYINILIGYSNGCLEGPLADWLQDRAITDLLLVLSGNYLVENL